MKPHVKPTHHQAVARTRRRRAGIHDKEYWDKVFARTAAIGAVNARQQEQKPKGR